MTKRNTCNLLIILCHLGSFVMYGQHVLNMLVFQVVAECALDSALISEILSKFVNLVVLVQIYPFLFCPCMHITSCDKYFSLENLCLKKHKMLTPSSRGVRIAQFNLTTPQKCGH